MDQNYNLEVPESLSEAYCFRLPRAYKFADYIWPGLLISPERLAQLRNVKFKSSDIIICSYPKSGTTWVSELVSLIVHKGDVECVKHTPLHERVPWLELDQGYAWVRFFWIWQIISKVLGIGTVSSTEKSEESEKDPENGEEIPRVFFTHIPLELMPQNAIDGGCRIVYISRNPKDTAVSFFHFHQMARFLGQQKTTWAEFFPLYTTGALYSGSWFEHVLGFWHLNKMNENMVFLKYESMKRDLKQEIESLAQFLKIDLTEEIVDKIANHCGFKSMKDNKMTNREGVWLFNHNVSRFMRKGAVGDWKNYFTVTQNEIFDKIYEQKMKGTGLDFEFQIDL